MENKFIPNVSKGFFKKIFGKDRIEGIGLTENGFNIVMEKGNQISISFENIKLIKTNFYLDKVTPYRTITILTNDEKEYNLDVSSKKEDVDDILKHYAGFQLKGDIPENINEINIVLQYGLNDYKIRLENGYLIETKKGQETSYDLKTIEYYRVDKPSNSINIKFKEKKLFVSLSAINVNNIWLILEILERVAKKQAWPI